MHRNQARRATYTVFAVAILCISSGAARAELVGLEARAESRVTEMANGSPGTKDVAVERYPETTSVLPMRAEAGVTDESGNNQSCEKYCKGNRWIFHKYPVCLINYSNMVIQASIIHETVIVGRTYLKEPRYHPAWEGGNNEGPSSYSQHFTKI